MELLGIEMSLEEFDYLMCEQSKGKQLQVVDGKVVAVEYEETPRTIEEQKEYLRELREIECFSIINRGKLWYNNLTEEQIEELNEWYSAWLEVTETLVEPTKPEWIK